MFTRIFAAAVVTSLSPSADAQLLEISGRGVLDQVINPEAYPGPYDTITLGDTYRFSFLWDVATQSTLTSSAGSASHVNAVDGIVGLAVSDSDPLYASGSIAEAYFSVFDSPVGGDGGDALTLSFVDTTHGEDVNFNVNLTGPPALLSSPGVPTHIAIDGFTRASFLIHTYGGVATGQMREFDIRVIPSPSAITIAGLGLARATRRSRQSRG